MAKFGAIKKCIFGALILGTVSAPFLKAESFKPGMTWKEMHREAKESFERVLEYDWRNFRLASEKRKELGKHLAQEIKLEEHKISESAHQHWADIKEADLEKLEQLAEIERAEWNKLKTYGRMLARFHLAKRPFDFPVSLLAKGTEGRVIPQSFHLVSHGANPEGFTQDVRYMIQVQIDLIGDSSYTEDLWLQYRPNLSRERQNIMLMDAAGNELQIFDRAGQLLPGKPASLIYKIKVLRNGLNAWGGNGQEFSSYRPLTQDRMPAAVTLPRSAQGIVPGPKWSTDCEDFIDANGNYGPWGLYIYNHNTSNVDNVLFDGPPTDVPNLVCPKYSSFNEDTKRNFWVWFAAAIAMEESSCNPHIHTQGTYGTAAGLWQLDLGKTNIYCGGVCGRKSIDVYDGARNVSCGLDMLNWYSSQPVNSSHNVFWKGNYWQTMHLGQPGQKKAAALIRSFGPCSDGAPQSKR